MRRGAAPALAASLLLPPTVGRADPAALPAPDTIRIERLERVCSAYLSACRTVDVYLPPGYDKQTRRRYPALYVNDGQDLPALMMKESLTRLWRGQALAELIVVAVHASEDRLAEYGVALGPNAQGLGDQAAAYGLFVTDELIPLIDGRYRTVARPAGRALLGSSLGGLSAFDIAWRRPDLFGAVGALSGSFWWRSDDGDLEARLRSRLAHRLVRETAVESGPPPTVRVWLEAGRQDETSDRDGDGVIDAIQDTRELIVELVRAGLRENVDIRYLEMAGGHDQATWAEAVPDFLLWAFGVVTRNGR